MAAPLSIAIGLTLLASLSAYVLTGPRVAYAMAQAGHFPAIAGRLSARSRTPAVATALQVAWALVLLWTGSFESIVIYASVGLALFSMLTVSSIYVLRRTRPDLPRPFRTPGYPLVPAVFLAATTTPDRRRLPPAALGLALFAAEHPGGHSRLSRLAPAGTSGGRVAFPIRCLCGHIEIGVNAVAMWFLIFCALANFVGLTAFFTALVHLRRESGKLPVWLVSRRGLGTLFILVAGAGLFGDGSYGLVHWIVTWRRVHQAQLAANPLLYDSPVLPAGLDFLTPRMAVLTAACLALMAVGAVLRVLVRQTDGGRSAHAKGPFAWFLAVSLIITLAELSVFQYYNQITIGIKGVPRRILDTSGINPSKLYKKAYTFSPHTGWWFEPDISVWEKVLDTFKGKPQVQYLEIGIYEGQSSLWILENVLTHPTARLTAIDPFFPEIRTKKIFYSNLKLSGLEEKANIIEGYSQIEMRKLPLESFDIIYIDGSHDATDCLEDAVLAWRLLKDGGILIFDNYPTNAQAFMPVNKPMIAIDTFMGLFGKHFDIMHSDFQVILKKRGSGPQKPGRE